MDAYSLDLRLKVLGAVDRGIPRKEVARTFGVSMPTLERYLRRRREGAELDPGRSLGRTPSICASVEERRALWR
jgi:transposase